MSAALQPDHGRRMDRRVRWHGERQRAFLLLWADAEQGIGQIAARFGITLPSIVQHAKRCGLWPRFGEAGKVRPAPEAPEKKPVPQGAGPTLPPLACLAGQKPARRAPVVTGPSSTCRFPVAGTGADGRGHAFCDAPSAPGRSWCERHLARVFVRQPDGERA